MLSRISDNCTIRFWSGQFLPISLCKVPPYYNVKLHRISFNRITLARSGKLPAQVRQITNILSCYRIAPSIRYPDNPTPARPNLTCPVQAQNVTTAWISMKFSDESPLWSWKVWLTSWFLDCMVARFGLRTNELLYKDIVNIIADILSAWGKAEYYIES